jgi:hypothetical protein
MKKRYWAVAAVAMTAIGAAYAADLHTPHIGLGCPDGFVGRYHFVNNQLPEGTPAGTINVVYSSGDVCTESAYKVLNHVQHFLCTGVEGTILSASTDPLPGKLVLSDFSCRCKKDEKTGKCPGA